MIPVIYVQCVLAFVSGGLLVQALHTDDEPAGPLMFLGGAVIAIVAVVIGSMATWS